jgi:glycosyltransferase involved in cell wall biosynthesis
MKLLHIIDRFNPDLGQEINFLAKNKSSDIDLTIFTSTSLKPWNIDNIKSIAQNDNLYKELYNVNIIRQKTCFEYGEKLWLKNVNGLIDKIAPDITYVHGIEYITFIRILLTYSTKKRKSFKLFTDTHSLPVFTGGSLFRTFYYSFLRKIVIPLVNKQNITTFYTAEENKVLLQDFYRVKPHLIKPFIIGADLKTFRFDRDQRENQRFDYHIKTDEILIIYTGRLCSQKGPHLILDALDRIQHSICRKVFVLFIGFQDKIYMQKEFNQHLTGKFEIIVEGPKPSDVLFRYYSAADFAVFPLESTLSSLECQACKLPVIMESNSTNKQRLSKGGMTYENGNINDLSEKITIMIQNDSYRSKLSHEGYTYICQNYDYLMNLRKMEDVLRN